ncbi:hypothetical protein [Actinoplanes sp. NBRC 101535]|uniref:hypothetical protein n=1 Tax=Actinoplanes sp. NBRC 101535 TaxID=3032196 RepID=UPI0024A55392|nr:hypothetical protein [Actinoplanes sp. NBRC 101535]GLY00791.1 hypothetical protein Acsp01_11700 [Actinoplanes sp. NBRC 101535]
MPDLKAIDLIYSHEGQYGWTVRSPQVPGLTGGRETDLDLDADVPSMPRAEHEPSAPLPPPGERAG